MVKDTSMTRIGRRPTSTTTEAMNPISNIHVDVSAGDEIDWRILLTLLMLILGGIFITFVAVLCWNLRFNAVAAGGIKRYRRRIYLVKQSEIVSL